MFPIILAPLVTFATHVVIGVVLDRMAKFRKDTDWTKVKIDADRKLRDLVPGEALDDAVLRAANEAIDKVQAAMGETAEAEKVLTLIASGDYHGAMNELLAHATGHKAVSAA